MEVSVRHAGLQHDIVSCWHLPGQEPVLRQVFHHLMDLIGNGDVHKWDVLRQIHGPVGVFQQMVVLKDGVEISVDDVFGRLAGIVPHLDAVHHQLLGFPDHHQQDGLQDGRVFEVPHHIHDVMIVDVLDLLAHQMGHLQKDLHGPGQGDIGVLTEAHQTALACRGLKHRRDPDVRIGSHEFLQRLIAGGGEERPVGLDQLEGFLVVQIDLLAFLIQFEQIVVEDVQLLPGERAVIDLLHGIGKGILAKCQCGFHQIQSLVPVHHEKFRAGQRIAAHVGGGKLQRRFRGGQIDSGKIKVDVTINEA